MRIRTVITQLLLMTCLISFIGCADNSPDGVIVQYIAKMNQIADAYEAGESEAKIGGLQKELEDLQTKMKGLDVSDDEKQALMKQHEAELKKASTRMLGGIVKGLSGKMGEEMNNAVSGAMDKMKQESGL